MPIEKCWNAILPLVFLCLCGCGSLLRVTRFDKNNPQGVPFFVKHGVCVQQTAYANQYWRLSLTYSSSDGDSFADTIVISEAAHGQQDFSTLVKSLAQQPAPNSLSVLTAWKQLRAADSFDPWSDLKSRRLLSNVTSLTAQVDYQNVYAINQKKPFSGSSQATFKLAADGTLTEGSGQLQDTTFSTIVSALPISSLVTSLAGIVTPTGKAENEKKVSAKFVLKQEERYVKTVYSQTRIQDKDICVVGPVLMDGDNIAVTSTDVGSTEGGDMGTQDNSISISGTIKLPKSTQPAASTGNTNGGSNTTTDGSSTAPSGTGQQKKN